MSQCIGKTKLGKPCSCQARRGSKYCFSHDPVTAAEAQEANKRGAASANRRATVDPDDLPRRKPTTLAGLIDHVAAAIRDLHTGNLGHHEATALANLAKTQAKLLEQCSADRPGDDDRYAKMSTDALAAELGEMLQELH